MRLLVLLSISSVTSVLATDSLLERLQIPFTKVDCKTAMDLFVVLDSSAFIGEAAFEQSKVALVDMVTMLDIGPKKVRMWVINYGQIVETPVAFHNMPVSIFTKENLIAKIRSIRYMYGACTATGNALQEANSVCSKHCRGLHEGVSRVVLVITGSHSNCGQQVHVQSVQLFSLNKASVFAVGVGSIISTNELLQISTEKKHIMHVDNYFSLIPAMKDIVTYTCGMPAFIIPNVKIGNSKFTNGIQYYQIDITELPRKNEDFQGGFIELIVHSDQSPIEVYTSTTDSNPGPQSGQRVQFQTRGSDLYYMEYIDKSTPRLYFSFYGVQPNNEYDFVVDWLDLNGNSIG